jgi:hypothetical protein
MLTVATVFLAGAAHAQLNPAAVTASSDGSVAANATDGNTGARRSASGNGQRLQVHLGATRTVSYVAIGVLQGQRAFDKALPRVCLGER